MFFWKIIYLALMHTNYMNILQTSNTLPELLASVSLYYIQCKVFRRESFVVKFNSAFDYILG